MKKLISLILSLVLVLTACAAMAEAIPTDYFEVNGEVLTVRVPAGFTLFWNNEADPELVTGGEEVNGVTVSSYKLPDGLGVDEQYLFPLLESEDEENPIDIAQCFEPDENGTLVPTIFDYYAYGDGVEISYFNVGDAPILYVALLGNPSTGYDWTYVPDNSGAFELLETVYEDASEETDEEIVGAPDFVVFELSMNAGMTQGAPMFQYARGEEAPIRTMVLNTVLDGNGRVLSVEPVFTAAE